MVVCLLIADYIPLICGVFTHEMLPPKSKSPFNPAFMSFIAPSTKCQSIAQFPSSDDEYLTPVNYPYVAFHGSNEKISTAYRFIKLMRFERRNELRVNLWEFSLIRIIAQSESGKKEFESDFVAIALLSKGDILEKNPF